MTRDELEAVIWRHGARRAVDVQAILLAADDYATTQAIDAVSEKTAQERRRAILAEAAREKRDLKPCGTWAAYRRHLYRHEPVCDACRDAAVTDTRVRRAARKADAA